MRGAPTDVSAAEVGPPSATLSHLASHSELPALYGQWARVGAAFGASPAQAPVDLEQLILSTAFAAPEDERLFVVAASWLAIHHAFVNGRRLAALATGLVRGTPTPVTREASAVLGALLAWATEMSGGPTSLEAAAARCEALEQPKPLFRVMHLFPSLGADVPAKALPRFVAWGLWHTDDTPKWTAVRPVAWLLEHAPELRLRAIAGPSLETDILAAMLVGLPGLRRSVGSTSIGVTVRDVAGALGVSYAAAHESAGKLASRGLLVRDRQGGRQILRPTLAASRLLD